MPTDKPRVMLTLDPDTHTLLQDIADATELSVSGIVSRLLGAHLTELYEYYDWLMEKKKGMKRDPRAHTFAKNLLQSYGPEGLLAAIRRLDPNHKFAADRLRESLQPSTNLFAQNPFPSYGAEGLTEAMRRASPNNPFLPDQPRESLPTSKKKK